MNPRNSRCSILLQAFAVTSLSASSLFAASGNWSNNAGGTWSVTTNWSDGTVADGSGFTATFGGAGNNIAGVTAVSLDSDRALTNLSFADDAPATPGSWVLNNNGDSTNNLILSGSTPTTTVAASSPVTISAIIEGTAGLRKMGNGILTLTEANTFTGGIVMGTDSNVGGADTSNGTNYGILSVTNSQALGTSAILINGRFQNQAKLQLSNDVAITTAGNITFQNSRQAIGALGGGGTGMVGGSGSFSLGYANIENLSGNNSLNSNMTIANGGGNGVNILSLAGKLTLTGDLSSGGTITGNRIYSFAGAGDTVVSGKITNGIAGISVTKENAGNLTLSGDNTFAGGVTIAAGRLLANSITGSSTGTGAVTVIGGATLGGTGIIKPGSANGISVASTGVVAPGDTGSIGALKVDLGLSTGKLTMASGSIFDWQLSGSGGTPDQINMLRFTGGDLVLNSNTINLSLIGAKTNGTYNVNLFNFYSDAAGATATAHSLLAGLVLSYDIANISSATINWGANSGNSIGLTYTVVPEPTSALAGLLITAGLLRRRRAA